MSRDGSHPSLHHDLRGALSAVQLNLQMLEALETREADVTPAKRLAIIRRGMAALAEAVEVADRLKGEEPGSAADPG